MQLTHDLIHDKFSLGNQVFVIYNNVTSIIGDSFFDAFNENGNACHFMVDEVLKIETSYE